ncbi:uncharacterized protein LOC132702270 [Cylas formicarius]|uniref:uncharacterized protein LOC132702270 n=1 Tax=Cylas formicarius TaxID=197179 RepID=UPI002958D52F|nr:uncharacterized protein LOC132702270 [Cylas formicarius]
MSLPWISVNNRLHQGISLINNLPAVKFQLLISHIATHESDVLFSDDELKKLGDSLKLQEAKLQLLLQSISYIFKQSSKVILKPSELQRHCTEVLKLEPQKAEEFVKQWSHKASKDLGELDARKKVEGLSWELNLQTASNLGNKQALPNGRLQFELSDATNADTGEQLVLEMGESNLLHLYSNLEAIQAKLDTINKKQ